MIDWNLVINSNDLRSTFNLLDNSLLSIKETDSVEFIVKIEEEKFQELGVPYVLISDIPIPMELKYREESKMIFKSIHSPNIHESRIFYNYFGQSNLTLQFEHSSSHIFSKTVDILVRKENAVFAKQMLDYLTSHMEDAIQICFSRSQVSTDLSEKNRFKFTKLEVVKETVDYLKEYFHLFKIEHKYEWKQENHMSEQGRPTGPDSIIWALSNLDKLSPSSREGANIIFNNRGHSYPELPRETLVKNTDVYENRVINSHLFHLESFLSNINDELTRLKGAQNTNDKSEYIRFDNLMEKYKNLVLESKINEIKTLFDGVRKIKLLYKRHIPSKHEVFSPPKLTSYARKKTHYRVIFQQVEKFNTAPSPKIGGNEMLFGLKNLYYIYEITCLILIHKMIKNTFSADIIEQSYYEHGVTYGYGGERKNRPVGKPNNYFSFINSKYTFELQYEPVISPLNKKTKPGDLIYTGRKSRFTSNKTHHLKPDYVLKIRNNYNKNVTTVIMDAKYKDKNNVEKYDIDKLTNKYLLNIHQVKANSALGASPIQLMIALFAHPKSGNFTSNVSNIHSLDGAYPIYPQTVGVHFMIGRTDLLEKQLSSLIKILESEENRKLN